MLLLGFADSSVGSSGGGGNTLTGLDKLAKESLDAELETLSAIDKKFRENSGTATSGDPGAIFDVVRFVYHLMSTTKTKPYNLGKEIRMHQN